jgi:hypothetical protein
MQSRRKELLNIDARNKNGVDILNPYRELSVVLSQGQRSKRVGQSKPTGQSGSRGTSKSRPYKQRRVRP